jgi:hypothetical protein
MPSWVKYGKTEPSPALQRQDLFGGVASSNWEGSVARGARRASERYLVAALRQQPRCMITTTDGFVTIHPIVVASPPYRVLGQWRDSLTVILMAAEASYFLRLLHFEVPYGGDDPLMGPFPSYVIMDFFYIPEKA